jgi:trehalose 6-phosphate synthase
MLSNDFIGFHAKEYCDNYLEALQEWFPVEIKVVEQFYQINHQGGITTIGALPIGLDVDTILTEVSEEKLLEYEFGGENLKDRIFRDRQKGMKIFGGLERCDYTKGLLERLPIFQNSLSKLRTIGREARFYQVTAPSRLETLDYKDLQEILKQEVLKMNEKLQGEHIVHIDKGISPPQNYRFMKEMDIMFVTPLEDGMNLVAFEYILSQKYKRPEDRGILVLSTSGASRVLKHRGFSEEDGIVFINPMRKKEAGYKAAEALIKGRHLSEKVISYVERERRVDDWAEKNMDSILNCPHRDHAGG